MATWRDAEENIWQNLMCIPHKNSQTTKKRKRKLSQPIKGTSYKTWLKINPSLNITPKQMF